MTPKELAKKMNFTPLKWTEFEKLDPKAKDEHIKKEREYNFERKMLRKYGNSVEKGSKKLNKFFA